MAAMSLSTFLQCTQCRYSGRIAKAIPPRAVLRCPRCKEIIRLSQSDVSNAEKIIVPGDLPPELLFELFTPDDRPPRPVARNDEIDIRCFTDSNEPLPPRAEAAVPTGKKKLLIDGMAPSFHQSRGFITAILIAAVAMVGFAFVRWYVDSVKYLSMRVDHAGKARGKQLDDLAKATLKKKASSPLMKPSHPPPSTGATMRTLAPATAQIGELVVGVEGAQAPSDPEKDPRIRSAVKAAYRECMKQIRRSSVSMSPKAAASKQRKEEATLIRALADQFTLRVEQINRMIADP